MNTYVLLTKLTSEVMRDLKHRERFGKKWIKEVSARCPQVKWICHYAILGPYDFIDIFEAPDGETAAKVSMITRETGAFEAECWGAIPYNRFLELVEDIT